MILDKLIQRIEERKIVEFKNEFINSNLTELEKQELLTNIMDYHYTIDEYSFFNQILNIIIDSKVNLNFNIDHWAPTLLSLVIDKAPSVQLFNYFIKKGAELNFIGDSFYNMSLEEIEFENKYSERYMTCLDFAHLKLNDLLTVDYNFIPAKIPKNIDLRAIDNEEIITISKSEYFNLIEQSQYLNELINMDKIVDHIKSLNGKTYNELKRK
jgi:hypothetical protein